MSTKIYNGYRLPMMSFPEFHVFVMEFRQKLKPVLRDLFGKELIGLAVDIIDRNLICSDKKVDYPLSEARKMIEEDNKSKYREPRDFRCQLAFAPCDDKIYVLIYTEQQEFVKLWESLSGVEQYFYWNNTDPPEDISDDKWAERAANWDKALSCCVPAEVFLHHDCVNWFDMPLGYEYFDNGSYLKYVPPFEKRIQDNAKNALFVEKANGLSKDAMWELFMDFSDYLKDNPDVLQAKCDEIRVMGIKEELTKEDFFGVI